MEKRDLSDVKMDLNAVGGNLLLFSPFLFVCNVCHTHNWFHGSGEQLKSFIRNMKRTGYANCPRCYHTKKIDYTWKKMLEQQGFEWRG